MTINFDHPTVIATPIISSIYTADPSARLGQDGRMYLYCSHDCYPKGGNSLFGSMDHYHVFSSSDLVEWRDEGEILCSDDVEQGLPHGDFMWAPDCVYKNGKYYFYFPHPDKDPWYANFQTFVAVSDHPAKDFTVLGFVEGIGGDGMIDPCVFIDDDGRNYLYYGGCGKAFCIELADDMITPIGEIHPLEGLGDYHEGPWVFKRNGVYYMSYPDNHPGKNRMCYATATSPFGPWESKGAYLAPTGSGTTHGSVARMNGRWFCFYHNCAISGDEWLRSVCVDELFFDEQGNILPVAQTNTPVEPAGPCTPSGERCTYSPLTARLGGGAAAKEQTVSVEREGQFIQFKKVNGGCGGRAQLHFTCSRIGKPCSFTLLVNGKNWGGVNVMPGTVYMPSTSTFTVPLNAGKTNEVVLQYLDGEIEMIQLQTEFLDQ